ncbi:hypothetical protein GPECTOR_5g37 [Gonium pectorale]|uniref:Uncharacterized protein n=1 Tax=Gonium pectorale TaxID=33097 RepID=A0A150GX71_GONPE|nr:hypothetical protein GPECTOR_5g37 [Gonium pectorale]|eukprot:KXZ54282.1 hypothetical protein GPECTOR_5g37 [Gonium pectorale]
MPPGLPTAGGDAHYDGGYGTAAAAGSQAATGAAHTSGAHVLGPFVPPRAPAPVAEWAHQGLLRPTVPAPTGGMSVAAAAGAPHRTAAARDAAVVLPSPPPVAVPAPASGAAQDANGGVGVRAASPSAAPAAAATAEGYSWESLKHEADALGSQLMSTSKALVEVEYVREGRVPPAGEGLQRRQRVYAAAVLMWLQARTWREPLVAIGAVEEGAVLRETDKWVLGILENLLSPGGGAPSGLRMVRELASQVDSETQRLAADMLTSILGAGELEGDTAGPAGGDRAAAGGSAGPARGPVETERRRQQLPLQHPGGIGARAWDLIRTSLRLALRVSFAEPHLQMRTGNVLGGEPPVTLVLSA